MRPIIILASLALAYSFPALAVDGPQLVELGKAGVLAKIDNPSSAHFISVKAVNGYVCGTVTYTDQAGMPSGPIRFIRQGDGQVNLEPTAAQTVMHKKAIPKGMPLPATMFVDLYKSTCGKKAQ